MMKIKKSIFDEVEELLKKDENFKQYTQYIQRHQVIPDNPYTHNYVLLTARQGEIERFEDLMHPQAMLGAIDDPKSLRLYQNDIYFLSNLFSLAKNSKTLRYVFDALFYSFVFEVRLTSTLDGAERIYQAGAMPVTKPKGFRFFTRKKRPKEPLRYVFPEESEESVYE